MTTDKLKQYVAFVGGFLGALYLFVQTLPIAEVIMPWLNPKTIDSFTILLNSMVPLVMIGYGIYKNQYLLTPKAKEQEEVLKQEGLK